MKYIVSDEHKFVYFVVQKVACTSIKTALLPLFDFGATAREVTRKDGTTRSVGVHGLFGASDYQINLRPLLARMQAGEYEDYFKFAFVRNPWDRLVSCYCDKMREDGPGMDLSESANAKLYPGMPFAEFVEAVHEIPDREANIHFKSQYKTICGPGRDRPIMADFVGRFENLEADFAVVAEEIGAREVQLPHKMRSRSRETRSYTGFYDDRLRKLVYERYRDDVEIFNYSFGDPHGPPPLRQHVRGSFRPQRWYLKRQLLDGINRFRRGLLRPPGE